MSKKPTYEELEKRVRELELAETVIEKNKNSLKSIAWLLEKSVGKATVYDQPYGDLTELNRERVILGNLDQKKVHDIVAGHVELLETSLRVYERNGDYVYAALSSGWCRLLDAASRRLCPTNDNAKALAGGEWLCHESCWTEICKLCVQSGEPVEKKCHGGLRIYAAPVKSAEFTIGAIAFGYGDPPKDLMTLEKISKKFKVSMEELERENHRYEVRPMFLVEIAKNRLRSSAKWLGTLVENQITHRQLQQEKEKLNVTLQSIGDGVITCDIHGKVVLLNKIAEELTGWQMAEAEGKAVRDIFNIVHQHTRKSCKNPVDKALDTKSNVALTKETVLITRDGREHLISNSSAPIIDSNGKTVGAVLVFHDHTEKKELEKSLRQAQKMEAIGNLAGGIAHEFNNVLSIILGNAELAIDEMEQWHPAHQSLDEIKQASLRARDMVKQLLSFSRRMDLRPKPLDLKIIVKESLKLLRATIPATIDIRKQFEEKIDTVVADPNQIHQLLINLCNNSVHAMRTGSGILTIKLNNIYIDLETAKRHSDLNQGHYVRLSVSDTGQGISPAIINRVFDPYFTTKEMHQGTGMGLAVVHGIVKSHKGAIMIDTRPAKGATFHVYLPSIHKAAPPDGRIKNLLPTGSESILFVDDEAPIAKLCGMILRQIGYKVRVSTDSEAALEHFRSDPYGYDLVISDMTMPGLTGDRLAQAVLEIRPEIPFIICTGFSDDISPEKAEFLKISKLLMKPLQKANLAKAVRRVLDKVKYRTKM